MTLQLNLSAELQERLRQEAERCGQPVESVAFRLLEEHLPPALDARRAAAIALLHQWMEEDAVLSPEEEADRWTRAAQVQLPWRCKRA